jgi:hypothetical protein
MVCLLPQRSKPSRSLRSNQSAQCANEQTHRNRVGRISI